MSNGDLNPVREPFEHASHFVWIVSSKLMYHSIFNQQIDHSLTYNTKRAMKNDVILVRRSGLASPDAQEL
jgi:hypothetical protein